jgi:peptide-methionine (S)-S-oxide reductase
LPSPWQPLSSGLLMIKKATFGAGCFWGVEAAFRRVHGVVSTACGYEGGTTAEPTYEEVCTDETGHAEVVELEFDPQVVSYRELLDVFWEIHDPTEVDRQGEDEGTQYRTVIFTHDSTQEAEARESVRSLDASGKLSGPVATKVMPAERFWRAEEYHQQYFAKQPKQG